MKKSLLLTFALLFSVMAFAQSHIYLGESFDDNNLPEGWTLSEVGSENWSISASNHAGGEPNELYLNFFPPLFMETTRVITPAVNLGSTDEVIVSFKHCLNNNIDAEIQETPYVIGIATSTDKENWNVAWSEEYKASGVYNIFEVISTPDLGKGEVYFSLFFSGSTLTLNGWVFDDIVISTQNDLEIELISIDLAEMIQYGEHEVSFTVQNLGSTDITSFEAQISNGNNVIKETFDVNIEALAFQQFTFTEPIHFNPGSQNVKIEILSVNGTSESDITLEKNIEVGMGYAAKIPMIEHFSSSTCGYCVAPNQVIKQVLEENPGKYTYTKYPTKFPAPGDPYTTDEVKNRVNYYKVSGAPEFYLDGIWEQYEVVSPEDINNVYGTPTFLDVRGAFTVEGNTINIIADFMSYITINDVRAFISINEKTTTENALPTTEGGNGETEFHHIMMKMLPDSEGNSLNIKAGEYKRIEFSYDMSQTFMEDINDLEVALWIQDYESQKIFNSRYAYEYAEHCYPVQNMKTELILNCTGAAEIIWEAPEKGNPTKYNIYIDGELVAENNADKLIYHSEEPQLIEKLNSGTHIAEVVAVYENNKTSVSVAKVFNGVWDNVEENLTTNNISVYPNPVNDRLYIETLTQTLTIEIYDIYGRRQLSTVSCQPSVIDVENLKSGIYFVKINTEKGNIVKRIIKN